MCDIFRDERNGIEHSECNGIEHNDTEVAIEKKRAVEDKAGTLLTKVGRCDDNSSTYKYT